MSTTKTPAGQISAVSTGISKILVAIDDSEQSRHAVDLAAHLAGGIGAEVVVTHFREHATGRGGIVDLETGEEATRLMKAALDACTAAGVKAQAFVGRALDSTQARHILEVADESGADLIVIGTRGLATFTALFAGSVSHQIIHKTKRPVLIVP